MTRGRRTKWLSGIGGVVLIGGLVLANYGGGVTPAEAHDHSNHHPNPFKQILDKLNLILEKLNAGGGGGGAASGTGNYTMRWDTNILSTSRFNVLTDFGGAAVRDNNTGLVWEQSPAMMPTWTDARTQCLNKAVPAVGGTRGWRLPSVVELASLIDPSLAAPFVPGVFTGVQKAPYWSTTANADNPTSTTSKLSVNFDDGQVGISIKSINTFNYVWCVRGPMSESTY